MSTIADVVSLDGASQCAQLTGLQIAAGFVTWTNILKVFALVLGGVCFAFLFGRSVMRLVALFARVPAAVYDVLGYLSSAALLVGAAFVPASDVSYMVVPGCLLFGGTLMLTGKLHGLKPNPTAFSFLMTLVCGAVAWFYGNEIVGFGAVMAFMSFVGFTVIVSPLAYCIGFEDEAAMNRASAAGLLVCAVLVAKAWLAPDSTALGVFETGMLWLGPFVFALGMLITSTTWGKAEGVPYFLKQAMAIVALLALMGAGSLSGLDALRNVGVGFMILYLIEKPFEIPHRSATAYAATGLLVAVLVALGVHWTQAHPETVGRLVPALAAK
jgi:hypothetical protein